MTAKPANLVDVGRIAAVYGVKGWLKVQSFTEPAENVFDYAPWWLKTAHGVRCVEVDEVRPHGKGFVIHLSGLDDRDEAAGYTGVTIAVDQDQLPALDDGEYYWRDLQNLVVITEFGGRSERLGRVTKLLETGANDVLVVLGDEHSLDKRERLIPYIPAQFVLSVDLAAGELRVDWDPDF